MSDTTGAIGDSAQFHPAIAVYGSNTVYVVWEDKRNGEGVYFAKSTNGGASFGANVCVNDVINEPACWGPDISASASGLIYVAYQADKTAQGYGIWCSASDNGGESFVC